MPSNLVNRNQMEKKKSQGPSKGEATSFGFRRTKQPPPPQEKNPLPSVTACVTKETIEPIVIPSLPKPSTPKSARGKKEGKMPNRFGFRPVQPVSNKVSDLQPEVDKEVKHLNQIPARPASVKLTSGRSQSESRYNKNRPQTADNHQHQQQLQHQSVSKFTLHSSHLPRPQCAVRVGTTLHVDKWAKTVANNQTASMVHTSASSGAKNKFGFRGQSVTDPLKLEIEHLEESPSVTNKFRTVQQKRPSEIVFSNTRNKTFNIEELQNSTSHLNPPENPAFRLPQTNAITPSSRSSIMQESIRSNDSNGEEKLNRDLESSEKDVLRSCEECPQEEIWGHGEAMALEEDITCFEDIDQSPEIMNPPLRSVLLKIEDPTFATLAAMSKSGMLEDEKSPESPTSPDLSCGSPPSVDPLPPPPMLKDSPGTPMSPTHGSSSFSSDARDRDFLIDDEIADQPGLVFNTCQGHNNMGLRGSTNGPNTISSLAGQLSKVLANFNESPMKGSRISTTSMGTLSPCESLASDDLMVDFDRSEASNLEDLNDIEESVLRSELEMQSSQVMKEWNSILNAHPGLSNGMDTRRGIRSRLSSMNSVAPHDSPKSHRSSISSPQHKINRLAGRHSPNDDFSSDSGIKVDRCTYQTMLQEVVNIKTMLLRLKRVLNESESSDMLDSIKNGLYCGLSTSCEAGEDSAHQLADLRRQVVLLEHQMVEKDRTIHQLQEALNKMNDSKQKGPTTPVTTSRTNAATQTDRVRPLSTGPILLQTSADNSPHSTFVSYSTEVVKAHQTTPLKKNSRYTEGQGGGGGVSFDGSSVANRCYPSMQQHLGQQKVS